MPTTMQSKTRPDVTFTLTRKGNLWVVTDEQKRKFEARILSRAVERAERAQSNDPIAEPVVVAVGSHRARAKLETLLGAELVGFYNAAMTSGVDYHKIPPARLAEALKIKSIRVVNNPPELRRRRTI